MKKEYMSPTLRVVSIKMPTILAGSGFGANAQQNPGLSNSSSSRKTSWFGDDDDFDDR